VKCSSIRLWFCIAGAVVAAALADPLVEGLSNAGVFGHGAFTDRSTLDVVPALTAGLFFSVVHLLVRVRRALVRATSDALRGHTVTLLPVIFAMQIAVLATMETVEQIVVTGHTLGGLVWLGGPVWFALSFHAFVCVVLTFGLSALLRLCAQTTLRAIRRIRALSTRPLHGAVPIALRRLQRCVAVENFTVLGPAGNRAPPAALV